MEDKRVRRRGIAWAPRQSHVIEARRCVRVGIPIHPRWLPFLPPRLRVKAKLRLGGDNDWTNEADGAREAASTPTPTLWVLK